MVEIITNKIVKDEEITCRLKPWDEIKIDGEIKTVTAIIYPHPSVISDPISIKLYDNTMITYKKQNPMQVTGNWAGKWIKVEKKETLLTYNPLTSELIDIESGEIIYKERGDGEIRIDEVVAGKEFWEDGKTPFTLCDFVGEVLGIVDFKLI